MDDTRPKMILLGGNVSRGYPVAESLSPHFRVDVVDRMEDVLAALRREQYHAVMADVGDFLPLERGLVGQKASLVLNTIGEGVCIVDADGVCSWSNKRMRSFSPEVFESVKQICLQARSIFAERIERGTDPNQLHSKKFTIQSHGDRYLELMASPVLDEQRQIQQIVAVVWDATQSVRLQQKIDAIDAAGRELAKIESESIAKLSPSERLHLVRDKIIRFCRDLMHFDHFAIRVLDKRTNKLELVIAEGLPPEATEIDIYASAEGNGISGYVAATGRSYICHDTERDARYVLGIEHNKSSLTVPLRLHDKVVGVFNIESETVGAFNEDDRQFAKIFGRYVAQALNTLDLLVVERYTTTGRLAEGVVQEMAQPLNDIVTEAQSLQEEYIGDDNMRVRLNRITDYVESIRGTINDVAAGPKTVLGADTTDDVEQDPVLGGKRILIADDELNIRKTIANVMAKRGARCTICKDGYEAVTFIEQQPFDLVISDIKMPHRNGYEIFAAAKRHQESLPVVLMTGFGYDPNHSILRATQEGLSSVLFKPFKVDELLEKVRLALGPPETSDDDSSTAHDPQTS